MTKHNPTILHTSSLLCLFLSICIPRAVDIHSSSLAYFCCFSFGVLRNYFVLKSSSNYLHRDWSTHHGCKVLQGTFCFYGYTHTHIEAYTSGGSTTSVVEDEGGQVIDQTSVIINIMPKSYRLGQACWHVPLFSIPPILTTSIYMYSYVSIMPLLLMHTVNSFIVWSFDKEIKPFENNENFLRN